MAANLKFPCRDCRKTIPGGDTGGHCGRCHESFRGDAAFDNHLRRRDDGSGRTDCMDPASAFKENGKQHPYWQDDKGVWHYGPKMTEEAKRKAGWIE